MPIDLDADRNLDLKNELFFYQDELLKKHSRGKLGIHSSETEPAVIAQAMAVEAKNSTLANETEESKSELSEFALNLQSNLEVIPSTFIPEFKKGVNPDEYLQRTEYVADIAKTAEAQLELQGVNVSNDVVEAAKVSALTEILGDSKQNGNNESGLPERGLKRQDTTNPNELQQAIEASKREALPQGLSRQDTMNDPEFKAALEASKREALPQELSRQDTMNDPEFKNALEASKRETRNNPRSDVAKAASLQSNRSITESFQGSDSQLPDDYSYYGEGDERKKPAKPIKLDRREGQRRNKGVEDYIPPPSIAELTGGEQGKSSGDPEFQLSYDKGAGRPALDRQSSIDSTAAVIGDDFSKSRSRGLGRLSESERTVKGSNTSTRERKSETAERTASRQSEFSPNAYVKKETKRSENKPSHKHTDRHFKQEFGKDDDDAGRRGGRPSGGRGGR
ncbi:MAG: hypothetical protein PQ612_05465 [Rickettsiales bacterium]|nr:hypothetical protein [Pseudomonadota bacterium]MDA0966468.1 hypothetical protein [Pseudomonadota bacterium]MDG4543330.1 hypothetical protein [Rickettsiales bacterium]MDG4545596.1 hypothetical protein [Rickettsiales bacterium]MDG4548045.1 hypothetical protein [Rickettsiales bacterium]